MSAADAAVRIRGLVKRYGKLRAVDALDLDVPEGAVVGLIGPNGAGKTTTMLALATLLTPDEGTLSVFGHDPTTEPRQVRRLVGWMPDFFGLYDSLTCAEYLDFFAAAFRLPAAERRQRVDDLLELVDLTHRRDTDVATLSRGMQQRLGLARTLVHDPRLLILDEPASGLDPRARVELREILRELARQGKTILISSHILAELGELCDRIAIIEAGTLMAQGSFDEIRAASAGAMSITVRVAGGEEALDRAMQVVAAAGGLGIRVEGASIHAELGGGEDAVADLLADLVSEGVRVVSYTEQHGELERLFLAVTKGVVR